MTTNVTTQTAGSGARTLDPVREFERFLAGGAERPLELSTGGLDDPQRARARPNRNRCGDSRCGDVNRPGRSPNACSSPSIIRAVELLPLVPVTAIAG